VSENLHTSAAFARRIHRRLLSGDPIASAQLARVYLAPVVAHLRARFPDVRDRDLLWDAAADAILSCAEEPSTYDPQKSGLFGYLKMSARGDLLNALGRESRRRNVELDAVGRNRLQEDDEEEHASERDPEAVARSDETMRRVHEALPDPRDRQILHLMMDQVRETRVFAEVLGIENKDEAEQRRIVKRNKDRIKKRIQRLGLGLRG
jgi:RNA polymerase sigma factor (sigma-70 family)